MAGRLVCDPARVVALPPQRLGGGCLGAPHAGRWPLHPHALPRHPLFQSQQMASNRVSLRRGGKNKKKEGLSNTDFALRHNDGSTNEREGRDLH
ncbi:hypothetical protein Naga_100172g1 [Nannochloropsis gaditana]|uniref:Uncharacterized protein n=1 Tax=Nannochloropsis gaditana TaxID=72520 RepID=W7T1P4_9STRA|nr:hypothetical protein Naga_100172g1 [Nannochloropsis gaditana]